MKRYVLSVKEVLELSDKVSHIGTPVDKEIALEREIALMPQETLIIESDV